MKIFQIFKRKNFQKYFFSKKKIIFIFKQLNKKFWSLQNMEIISRKEMAKWFQKKYTVEDRNFVEGEVGKKDELILSKGLYSQTSICEIVRVWIILVEQKCVLL